MIMITLLVNDQKEKGRYERFPARKLTYVFVLVGILRLIGRRVSLMNYPPNKDG